ncbi:g4852 [Coccomyxa elongata]
MTVLLFERLLQKNFKGLEGRITKLESRSRKLFQLEYDDFIDDDSGPPVPQGCSSGYDKSQKCQQARQALQHREFVIGIFLFGAIGIVVVVVLTVLFCDSHCKRKQRPPPAPGTSAAPSQEMASLSTVAGNRGMIGQAIKQGDPNGIALAILRQLSGQRASLWPENYMYWADTTKYGAALARESVIFVFYSPVLTHEAADKLCHIIWGMRNQAQKDIGNTFPLKCSSIVYEAVAGLQLSKDAADIKQLLEKCRRHGLSIWVPSGCWQEGSMDAANAGLHAPGMSSNMNALWSVYQ